MPMILESGIRVVFFLNNTAYKVPLCHHLYVLSQSLSLGGGGVSQGRAEVEADG